MKKSSDGRWRLITWNINSVRLRLPQLKKLASAYSPDVICLQETKAEERHFPGEAIADFGYPHQLVRGYKGYNGVAILSRLPLQPLEERQWCRKIDARHATANVLIGGGAIEVHNLYVPAGGDIPDPKENEKFAHKLNFLDEMIEWSRAQARKKTPTIVVGDLNVAPLPADVWSHQQLLKVVSHTPEEVARFEKMMRARPWVDAVRHFVPESEKLYTWWSYRAQDWEASDRGRRLDHVLVNEPLAPKLHSVQIMRETRSWPQPSDHVPVCVTLNL